MNPWPTACWCRTLLFFWRYFTTLQCFMIFFFSPPGLICGYIVVRIVWARTITSATVVEIPAACEKPRSSAQTHSCAFTRAQPWDVQYLLDVIQRDKNGALFTPAGKGPALYVTECSGFHPGPPFCRRQTVATKLWVTLFNELENWPFWYHTDVLCDL